MHRLPFPIQSSTQHELMDLVAVDLAGPMTHETWTGKRYVLVAVEASTRYGVGRLLERKEEAPDVLREVIAMLERQSGRKLKRIRSDNGTEFVNNVMTNFCKRNGIL